MGLFGRKKTRVQAEAVAEHLVLDRCWNDIALDVGVEAVRDRHLNAAIALLRECRDDHELRTLRVTALGNAAIGQTAEIKELITEGIDRADAADILLLLGQTLICEAWEIRGAGPSREVGPERLTLFHSRLREARDPLMAAANLADEDATPWVVLLWFAIGTELDGEQVELIWRRVLDLAPTSFPAHLAKLQLLAEKWSGSHEEMFAFARQTVASAPTGSPLVAVLAMAHAEYLMREGGRLLEDGRKWEYVKLGTTYFTADLRAELIAAEQKWCSGAEPQPYAKQAHSIFGWAMSEIQELERARWHLSWVGNRPSALPWDYEGRLAFAKTLVRLGLTRSGDTD